MKEDFVNEPRASSNESTIFTCYFFKKNVKNYLCCFKCHTKAVCNCVVWHWKQNKDDNLQSYFIPSSALCAYLFFKSCTTTKQRRYYTIIQYVWNGRLLPKMENCLKYLFTSFTSFSLNISEENDKCITKNSQSK